MSWFTGLQVARVRLDSRRQPEPVWSRVTRFDLTLSLCLPKELAGGCAQSGLAWRFGLPGDMRKAFRPSW